MSLTDFVELREVREKIKPLRPQGRRKLDVPVQVPATDGKRSPLIGTAFDYLLRFELQRRAPRAKARRWVAEAVPIRMAVFRSLLADDLALPPERAASGVAEVASRVRHVIETARSDVAAFQRIAGMPDAESIGTVAAHALRLARLDNYIRSGFFDPAFTDAATADVETLTRLLAIVPFDQLIHDETLILNPTFGEASVAVGGADADLITGDMLVDVKTRKDSEIDVTTLDQLLGYLLLARRHRQQDRTFPEIGRLGVYHSRYGHLWTAVASDWTAHPDFGEVEQWFFEYAEKIRPRHGLGNEFPPWLEGWQPSKPVAAASLSKPLQ